MFILQKQQQVTLEDIAAVAYGAKADIDESVYQLLDERRNQLVAYIEETEAPAYGFNRGFGHNVDRRVPKHQLTALQKNLIRSHACGVGEPAPVEIVRAAMFLRAISLSRGHSGVRSSVVRMLIDMLNRGITPIVPMLGSVGASGDLAPMSHIALAMIGEGFAYIDNSHQRFTSTEALQKAGIQPLIPEMKEGLALTNGIQYSTAIGVLSYFKLKNLLETATIAAAISAQVMLGGDAPFRRDLHELRPHKGALKVSGWLRKLMEDSPIRKAHAPFQIDGEIQDPYNIRCAAQILGTCYDLIEEARTTLEIEANSVTDNPLILPKKDEPDRFIEIVSGGHFHGMPVAVKLYNLMQAMGIMARLSNMRCARYVDEKRNKGLGPDLKWPELKDDEDAISSGLMIPEYASAALTNDIWGACMPTHLFSLSTDAGQEDHASMSAGLAVRLWKTIPRLAEVIAIELTMGTQAATIRNIMDHIPSKVTLSEDQAKATQKARNNYENALHRIMGSGKFRVRLDVKLEYMLDDAQRRLSAPCEKAVNEMMKIFPPLKRDRYMADEIKKLADFVERGALAGLVKNCIIEDDAPCAH